MGFKNEHVHGKKDVARINERKARGRRLRPAPYLARSLILPPGIPTWARFASAPLAIPVADSAFPYIASPRQSRQPAACSFDQGIIWLGVNSQSHGLGILTCRSDKHERYGTCDPNSELAHIEPHSIVWAIRLLGN